MKTRSALEAKRKNGDFVGAFPIYGYIKTGEKHKRLEIDPFAASVVKEIFRMRLNGASAFYIAESLNKMGVLSPMAYKKEQGQPYARGGYGDQEGCKWSATTVIRILQDETYTGTLLQGRETTPHFKLKARQPKPVSEWMRTEDAHEAIISKHDYDLVQRLKGIDTRTAPNEESAYLFSGVLICGCCGGKMTRKTVRYKGEEYYYYYCRTGKKHGCANAPMIKEAELIQCVQESLKGHIENIASLENVLSSIDQEKINQAMVREYQAHIESCERQIKEVSSYKSGLYENLINGCIYPIDRVLVYTENVRKRLAGERIRIDMAAMFPEFINNDIRRPMSYYPEGATFTKAIPVNYRYLEDCKIEEGTLFYYFGAFKRGWSNYQMDEFNIIGKYEITMRLPPVPTKGHYEIRFGVSSGSSVRSMCQVYFGDNLNYLPAAGIPMDLRIGFVSHRFSDGNQTSNFGYTSNDDYRAELNLSMEEQDEITKSLRSRGFMKGPKYFHCGASNTASLGIECEWVTRRIMVSADMDPDKTYYIRFKNVLNNEKLQFFTDYLEFVSKDVYDNPVEPEDYW